MVVVGGSLYFNPKLPSSYLGPEKLYQIVKSHGRFKIVDTVYVNGCKNKRLIC